MPAGSLEKASSVGAKTVNGPAPLSVSLRPAASMARASMVNDPALIAVSRILLFSSLAHGAEVSSTSSPFAHPATLNAASSPRTNVELRMVVFMIPPLSTNLRPLLRASLCL